MKFVISVAVVALLSAVRGSGYEWLQKRQNRGASILDCLTPSCRNVFQQVYEIMGTPAFELLIEDGRLSLNCSKLNLERSDNCTDPSTFLCDYPVQINLKLDAVLDIFCSHKTAIEEVPSCWTSGNLLKTVMSCADNDSYVALYTNQNHFCTESESECECRASQAAPCQSSRGKEVFDGCAEQRVGNLTECSAAAGAMMRELILVLAE